MPGHTTDDDPRNHGSGDDPSDRSLATLTDSLTRDDLFDLLQARRRRLALWYLHERAGGSEGIRTLASHVAALETNTDPSTVDPGDRQRVQLSLYQSHLPKLEDYDVITYDQGRELVELTPVADAFLPYLAAEPSKSTRL